MQNKAKIMAKLVLDLKKSVAQNAGIYFEKAKKTRKKLRGAEEALSRSLEKLRQLEKKKEEFELKEKEKGTLRERKKEWYEKFRWFLTSDNFLVDRKNVV